MGLREVEYRTVDPETAAWLPDGAAKSPNTLFSHGRSTAHHAHGKVQKFRLVYYAKARLEQQK